MVGPLPADGFWLPARPPCGGMVSVASMVGELSIPLPWLSADG
jgi:hypothetical protein